MTVSHTLIVAAVLCGLLVCGRADLCAPDCRGGSGYLPHPQVCNSFYQCSHGTAFLKHCPAGLEFSFTSLNCDYPAQAGCTSDPGLKCGVAAPSQEPDPTESAPTTLEASKCTPACPTPEALYPHPHDCTKYFHCAGSVPYLKSCPLGQEYSGPLSRCDYPDLAKCTADAEAPCLAATYAPTTASPQACTPKCPEENALFPNPQDCSKFYICEGMVPVVMSCPTGLFFDMRRKLCVDPEWSHCRSRLDRACDEYLSACTSRLCDN